MVYYAMAWPTTPYRMSRSSITHLIYQVALRGTLTRMTSSPLGADLPLMLLCELSFRRDLGEGD